MKLQHQTCLLNCSLPFCLTKWPKCLQMSEIAWSGSEKPTFVGKTWIFRRSAQEIIAHKGRKTNWYPSMPHHDLVGVPCVEVFSPTRLQKSARLLVATDFSGKSSPRAGNPPSGLKAGAKAESPSRCLTSTLRRRPFTGSSVSTSGRTP